MYAAPLTELEAVNDMLAVIGQAPVNAFTANNSDQNIARQELAKVVREVRLRRVLSHRPRSACLPSRCSGLRRFRALQRRDWFRLRPEPRAWLMPHDVEVIEIVLDAL